MTGADTRPASTLNKAPSMPATAIKTRNLRISSNSFHQPPEPGNSDVGNDRRGMAGECKRARGFSRDR